MRKFTKQQIIILISIVIVIAGSIIGLVLGTARANLITQPEKTCRYNGTQYKENETFISIDECNTCRCGDGRILCTVRACAQDTLPTLPIPQ